MSLIIEMLQESYHKHANKAALRRKVDNLWVEYSYELIWDTSDRIAAGLAAWGVDTGDRVALSNLAAVTDGMRVRPTPAEKAS